MKKFSLYKAIVLFIGLAMTQVQAHSQFAIEALSQQSMKAMIETKVWSEKCPVPLDRLKVVKFSYFDFDEKMQADGQIVVLDAVAPRVMKIFKQLYDLKYPIAKAHPLEAYRGDDTLSMADNNTACFNCREITGGGAISIHSYGLALDINPVQNPYIAFGEKESRLTCKAEIQPAEGSSYMNRTNLRPGMVESIIDIFKKNGFMIWGGQWNTPIDWQHFQPSRTVAQLLAIMQPQGAEELFEIYIQHPHLLNTWPAANRKLEEIYKRAPQTFMEVVRKTPQVFDEEPKIAEEYFEKEIGELEAEN